MRLQRDLHEPNLLTPTGKSAEIDLPLPQPTKSTVEHSSGRLVILGPESLRANPAKADGLRPVSVEEAVNGVPLEQPPAGATLRPVLAFMFTQEPVTLRLAVERRKPQVTIRQLLVARIDEGVIKYQATFFYSIRYSGVKSLRIDVPADVAPLLRNTTAGIHEKTIDPPPRRPGQGHGRLEPDGRRRAAGRRPDRPWSGRRSSTSSTWARPWK